MYLNVKFLFIELILVLLVAVGSNLFWVGVYQCTREITHAHNFLPSSVTFRSSGCLVKFLFSLYPRFAWGRGVSRWNILLATYGVVLIGNSYSYVKRLGALPVTWGISKKTDASWASTLKSTLLCITYVRVSVPKYLFNPE